MKEAPRNEDPDWDANPAAGTKGIAPITVDEVMDEFPDADLALFFGNDPLDVMADLLAESERLVGDV